MEPRQLLAATAVDDSYMMMMMQNIPWTESGSGVLTNDTPDAGDAENPGEPFNAVMVTGPATGTGTVTLNTDGSFTYTPPNEWVGVATFTYRASATSNVATVTFTVMNNVPSPQDDNFSLMDDQEFDTANPGDVAANDTDADLDLLTFSVVSGPSDAANFVFNSDGTFEYRPIADWDGTDQFTYEVDDGFDTAQATVTIGTGEDVTTASAFNPVATPGTSVGQFNGVFVEGGLDDVVTVYDDRDEGYDLDGDGDVDTADASDFSNAADFGTPIGAHDWANLVAALAAYVVTNGLINQLVMFDHGNASGQEFGNDIITAAMWDDIANLLSTTCTIRLAGCCVGSNAAYCNSVAAATGATVEATSGIVWYRTRWGEDYWADNGVWLSF